LWMLSATRIKELWSVHSFFIYFIW
jgi:hypothetical protein